MICKELASGPVTLPEMIDVFSGPLPDGGIILKATW
jgi:hypothetical protein